VARRRINPERLAALAGAASPEALDRARLDLHGALAGGGGVRLAADLVSAGAGIVLERVRKLHLLDPAAPGVPLATVRPVLVRALRRVVDLDEARLLRAAELILDGLVADGSIVREGGVIRDPSHVAPGLAEPVLAAMGRLETVLDVPAPPSLAEAARATGCPPAGIRVLEDEGRLIRVADDLAWAAGSWRWLARTALDHASRAPLTPATLRDATGTSRKYVMALLEDLDRRQILRRTPGGHVPGPRAASLAPAGATAAGR
jgi:selenocysteine-specific elongation factor